MPGQPRKRQVRSVFLSAGSVACMAPVFGPPFGTPISDHLDKPALAILETQWRTPYHYDLFKGDVGHTLVLGATGSGQEFRAQFPSGPGAPIRPPRSHSGPGRLLPLADELSRRWVHGAFAGEQ